MRVKYINKYYECVDMARGLINQLVVGFGFFNGLWFSLGINPQQEIITFLKPILSGISPWVQTLFIILPTLLTISTILTLIKIYHKGRLLGAGAVALAFLAGALVLTQWMIAIVILLIAAMLASVTMNNK